jgi:hypothetical protein
VLIAHVAIVLRHFELSPSARGPQFVASFLPRVVIVFRQGAPVPDWLGSVCAFRGCFCGAMGCPRCPWSERGRLDVLVGVVATQLGLDLVPGDGPDDLAVVGDRHCRRVRSEYQRQSLGHEVPAV